jgi:hypothetical protein
MSAEWQELSLPETEAMRSAAFGGGESRTWFRKMSGSLGIKFALCDRQT